MKNKLDPLSLVDILHQHEYTIIFTQLTDSKIHGYDACLVQWIIVAGANSFGISSNPAFDGKIEVGTELSAMKNKVVFTLAINPLNVPLPSL